MIPRIQVTQLGPLIIPLPYVLPLRDVSARVHSSLSIREVVEGVGGSTTRIRHHIGGVEVVGVDVGDGGSGGGCSVGAGCGDTADERVASEERRGGRSSSGCSALCGEDVIPLVDVGGGCGAVGCHPDTLSCVVVSIGGGGTVPHGSGETVLVVPGVGGGAKGGEVAVVVVRE